MYKQDIYIFCVRIISSVDFLILNAKIFNIFLLKKDGGKYFICIYVGNFYFFYVNSFYQRVGYWKCDHLNMLHFDIFFIYKKRFKGSIISNGFKIIFYLLKKDGRIYIFVCAKQFTPIFLYNFFLI